MENLISEMSLQIRSFYNYQHEHKAVNRNLGKSKKKLKGNIHNPEMEEIKEIDNQLSAVNEDIRKAALINNKLAN